jgi:ribosomal protein S18 acetylase RimI-like enzyme
MAESMNTLCIRLATLADVDTVAPLFDAYRQFYEQAPNLALAKDFIRDRLQKHESVVLLAFKGSDKDIGELVGFCQLYPTFCSVEAKPIYALYDLFVKPQARRLGVGHALLKAAEQQARDSGMSRMDLTTAKTNQSAQAAYESLGWKRDEVFYAYNKSVG